MHADTFYRFGAALGLTQGALEALLDGGELPLTEDAGNGYILVTTARADTTAGCEGASALVRGTSMKRWVKELKRLRNEEKR